MIAIGGGKILCAIDHGSVWQLLYEQDQAGVRNLVFDHRPFANFYEGATGRDFFKDYDLGRGREYVSQNLKGLRIIIEGEDFEQRIRLESD